MTSSKIPSFAVGVDTRISLSARQPLYLRTGLSYQRKGYEINGFDDSRTTLDYIQIPLAIDYAIGLTDRLALIPYAGIYYAVGVNGSREMAGAETDVFSDEGGFSRHDLGAICGIDLSISHLSIGLAYMPGILYTDKEDRVYGDNANLLGYKNVRNNGLLVKVGYNF